MFSYYQSVWPLLGAWAAVPDSLFSILHAPGLVSRSPNVLYALRLHTSTEQGQLPHLASRVLVVPSMA